ncbi:MAG: hypothetical protein H0T89_29335 [Deltaproteobacteria bacterium]|nr:hypothetical protein [Deltaproteobacteria bacterium]MDQ3297213.1 hypothetical protein [Myxococcota bacterium]
MKRALPKRAVRVTAYFKVGDVVLMGKYKNVRGVIVGFGEDQWGNPTVEIEPTPKGRKQNKTIGLFKIWRADVKEDALKRLAGEPVPRAPRRPSKKLRRTRAGEAATGRRRNLGH